MNRLKNVLYVCDWKTECIKTKIMTANELRIGNKINCPYGICYVFDINPSGLSVIFGEEIFTFDIDELKPIELTTEILSSCNLLKNNGYPFKFLDGFIKIRNGVYFFQYHKLDVELKYLHQFQNLAYSLNNKELELNL